MGSINLLYKDEIPINDKVRVVIPTVRDVLNNEDNYYSLLGLFTAAPIDLMLPLSEAKIDFTTISDFDLFLILFPTIQNKDTSLILKDIDLSKFKIQVRSEDGVKVLRDPSDDIVIDRIIHMQIASALRKLHGLTRNNRKPATTEAKDYMIERAKEKSKRKKRTQFSMIEQEIISLVNTEQFKYNYDSTLDLTMYQFNESIRQIQKKIIYDHTMNGVYAGTVDPKKLSQQDLTWLANK